MRLRETRIRRKNVDERGGEGVSRAWGRRGKGTKPFWDKTVCCTFFLTDGLGFHGTCAMVLRVGYDKRTWSPPLFPRDTSLPYY